MSWPDLQNNIISALEDLHLKEYRQICWKGVWGRRRGRRKAYAGKENAAKCSQSLLLSLCLQCPAALRGQPNNYTMEPLWVTGSLISPLYFINIFHTSSIQYIQSFLLSCFEFLMLLYLYLSPKLEFVKYFTTHWGKGYVTDLLSILVCITSLIMRYILILAYFHWRDHLISL